MLALVLVLCGLSDGGIEFFEFDASGGNCERPMDVALFRVSILFPRRHLADNVGFVVDATIQALTIQDVQFDLRHIQPATMFWRGVKFESIENTPCFFWWIGFVQTRPIVCVQVIFDDDHLSRKWKMYVHQLLDALGPVSPSTPIRDFHVPPAT